MGEPFEASEVLRPVSLSEPATPIQETKQETQACAYSLRTLPTCTGNADAKESGTNGVQKARSNLKRKIGLLCFFYLLGLGTTVGHWAYYIHLNGTVVGDGFVQQRNIR